MNREWRHQFGPEIIKEKGCWNVIAVLLVKKRYEMFVFSFFFFLLTSLSTMKCVGEIKLFSRDFGIRKIKEMLYPSIFAFYQSNVLYLHSFESKYGVETLKAINPSK